MASGIRFPMSFPPFSFYFNLYLLVNKGLMCHFWFSPYISSCGLQSMAVPDKCKLQVAVNHVGNGLHHNQSILESSFLSGIKQRLLSFIFSGIWTEETDQTLVCHVADKSLFL